jgi:hypothetical protein
MLFTRCLSKTIESKFPCISGVGRGQALFLVESCINYVLLSFEPFEPNFLPCSLCCKSLCASLSSISREISWSLFSVTVLKWLKITYQTLHDRVKNSDLYICLKYLKKLWMRVNTALCHIDCQACHTSRNYPQPRTRPHQMSARRHNRHLVQIYT